MFPYHAITMEQRDEEDEPEDEWQTDLLEKSSFLEDGGWLGFGALVMHSQGWLAKSAKVSLSSVFTFKQPVIKLFTSSLSFNCGNQVSWALLI